MILLTAMCFAVMDTSIKYLSTFVPALLMLWVRYAVQAVAMALWLALSSLRSGSSSFRAARPHFQFVRGVLLLISSAMMFFGIRYMPVAEFTAVGMLAPVVVTLLAAWLLKESVSRLRWALVWGAFAGALIVIRPGSGMFGWAAVFPLLMALSYGSFQVLTSKLASVDDPYTTHFYTGLTGTVLVAPVLLASGLNLTATLQALPAAQVALMLGIGALGTAGHLFLILALGLAPTATLMPFIYTQIAFALAASWWVFRHVPDAWAWVGMGVIAVCGAASIWLNMRSAVVNRRLDAQTVAATAGD